MIFSLSNHLVEDFPHILPPARICASHLLVDNRSALVDNHERSALKGGRQREPITAVSLAPPRYQRLPPRVKACQSAAG
jgi:hypothetical protein